MTNWTDTATPTTVSLGNRFAPWKIFCTTLNEDADDDLSLQRGRTA